ncbi:carbonic anhydrase [Metschnikowia bicuspidata]|uniref:Carbonic anhydrase n=1 Tax=Metschnikowia bicuspidata TaxID=27322 RepID=A0A4P9ZI10_9ASCO|nr:carbonic anhydrase [Metschnikowia bicuspidata]
MGRENIIKYQLEYDKDTDIPRLSVELHKPPQKVPVKPVTSHDNGPFTLLKDSTMQDLLANNKYYVDSIRHNHGCQVFDLNGKGQSPHTLWLGCSDSRAGELCLAVLPGEIFTHRNIANIINANDISSQGAIQYAVDVLKVRKIIVCGHTDCGGVWASLSNKRIGGVLDLWLNPIRHIRTANRELLDKLKDNSKERAKKLAELNVIASVLALKRHPSALNALNKGEIEVWGMMYDVGTGYLSQVEMPADEFEDLFLVSDDQEDEHNGH